ncbi:MAG: sigma-54-dependent Fis family transcriptional regulator [Deltaproteobacteria bacterium]|nr:sigma-54-dependent Fis family transcriptional regulator [Deltaproteobacteria bacterium]
MAEILIVDQERIFSDSLQQLAAADGIRITWAESIRNGINLCLAQPFDVILLKNQLTDGRASDAIPLFFEGKHSPELIVYADEADPDEAEQVLTKGAWDYIIYPWSPKSMMELLLRAIRFREEKQSKSGGKLTAICAELQNEGIVGSSSILQSCLNIVAKAAQSDANILITGESGTGKELFAAAIHKISPRADKKFVIVDCAALPAELVESILFGHERGAFTGATKNKSGLVELAHNGTLFLDEVGELPLEIQKKFLRVLQERVFLPVGSTAQIRSNFRLIAATNKDLDQLQKNGAFREDLLYRLKTFHLELPSLRIRVGDITELAYYFRSMYSQRTKEKEKGFSPDFLMVLKQYSWPGNVRELFQVLERSITAAGDYDTLYPMHLPTSIRVAVTRQVLDARQSRGDTRAGFAANRRYEADGGDLFAGDNPPTLQAVRQKAIEVEEKKYLQGLMEFTRGDIKKSCRISELSRSRLYDLLKKYQLTCKNG